jgi:hypothetical protein
MATGDEFVRFRADYRTAAPRVMAPPALPRAHRHVVIA